MITPEPSPTRPLRVAGLALLGVAAIAMVIGLVSLFGGNGNGQADGNNGNNGDNEQPPASTSTSEPGSTSSEEEPPSSSRPPSSGSTSRPPSTTSVPPSVPPGGDGNGEPGKTQQVRVLNNSTVDGLANQAANDLREAGWPVAEVGNYPSGVIPTTTVYFRPGTAEESAAELLADEFGMRTEPRFAGLDYGPGLIVIVTGDYQGPGGHREETEKNDK
jgi:LytR cell envelope-related transcriptional attenuator